MTTKPSTIATVVRAPGAHAREATLPKTIRTRINLLAHHCGLRHEAQVKAALMQQLQDMHKGGADLTTLAEVMAGHEHQDGT
jgi:hypothetical protein